MARRTVVRPLAIAVVVAAALAAAVFAYSNRPLSVRVAAVERDVAIRVFGLGTVEARISSEIGFEVGGRLVELNADHGDTVAKGAVLARLDLGEQEARVAKARAALAIAQANIRKAAANLQRAEAVFLQKQETNRRRQALAGSNVVSRQAAEEAQRDEDVARADVLVATSETEVANAQLADAGAQLRFEETMLGHRTLHAPYDGVVVARRIETGTVVKAGDPIFTLVAAGTYWGLAYVDEARAGYIEVGQTVDARLRSRPREAFTGRVARIALESDRVTEERRVFVRGDNPPPQVYLGEQVEIWITVARVDEGLFVPEAAVRGYDGRRGTVWTVESGRLARRTVEFGHRTEDARLEIVGGLPAGAGVVTQVESGMREGRAARPVVAAEQ